jgi:hypothetical protein|tara:strand:- start:7130 stop:7405 length:276 start_codon:yes stop_codon:yes gene_type:complete
MKKITRRNFLLIISGTVIAVYFFKRSFSSGKKILLDKNIFFSSYCSLIDNKKNFIQYFELKNYNKDFLNQTIVGPYYVNSDEVANLKNKDF